MVRTTVSNEWSADWNNTLVWENLPTETSGLLLEPPDYIDQFLAMHITFTIS